MAPIVPVPPDDQVAWNQAHERLTDYLGTFALHDRTQVSRLAVRLTDEARALYQADRSIDPVTLTMNLAQKRVSEWLAANLGEEGLPSPQLVASGGIALLLSGASRRAPQAFLTAPLDESLRHSMRQTLLATGPDLNVSSMTPRHLDYGPMLRFAQQTWHRWDLRSILVAVIFWTCIYTLFYFALPELI